MATWVALFRGINVGRNKRIAMADLRTLLEGLGYDDVRTVLQSGNAIFTAPAKTAAPLEREIAARIEQELGMDVTVLVRSANELTKVLDGNPFVPRRLNAKELGVTFLSAVPSKAAIAKIERSQCEPDEFEFATTEIYTRQPNGIMGTRLPNWEKVLGVRATARNWNTVTRVLKLATP